METLSIALVVLIGILLRFGLPILVMVGIVYLLRRMDTRWQEEARKQMTDSRMLVPQQTSCWEVNNCSPETKEHCPAYINPGIPCWQQFRSDEGLLRESCLGCSVFRNAPVPVYVS
jgi:hypothetical protein